LPRTNSGLCRRAKEFVAAPRRYLGDKPVSAIIYTDAHLDHFGGASTFVSQSESQNVPIIVPTGFVEAAVSETLVAGPAMNRRLAYSLLGYNGSLILPHRNGRAICDRQGLPQSASVETSILLEHRSSRVADTRQF